MNTYTGWYKAQAACKVAATDAARYGDPDFPWFSFGSFLKGSDYPRTGIGVVVEPRAQYSNGFGAKVNSQVICKYDLKKGVVVDVKILPL